MKASTVIQTTVVAPASNQNSRTCSNNITKNVARLVIESETHAHNTLPTALPMLAIPTMLAATTAVTPTSSWNIGASCEMTEMPANVFRKSNNHNAYHCHVRSALLNV